MRPLFKAAFFLLAGVCLSLAVPLSRADDLPSGADAEPLRRLDVPGEEYRSPLAGEGFQADIFGERVRVEPRDRRKISAWDLGFSAVAPGVSGAEFLPYASLYFWRRPDETQFLRAIVTGLYNDVIYSRTTSEWSPLEAVFYFGNYTIPVGQTEIVDGKRFEEEELIWGTVRAGAGLGYRRQLGDKSESDNQLAISLLAEPGFFYADETNDTAPGYVAPKDTFEGRVHLKVRLDRLDRNLFANAHSGFAAGADLFYGWRDDWEDWGQNAQESASSGRDYVGLSGFVKGAARVPFVQSDRHRLIASLHGGVGDALDRFSAFRVGGGPSGDEFEAIARPILPGAVIEEYTPEKFAIALVEYRWEPVFFVFASVRTSVSYVERFRRTDTGVEESGDVLPSIGARLYSGFFFETLVQLDYNYNFGVIRRDDYGGNEVTLHISRSF